jgi:hypothetical protein
MERCFRTYRRCCCDVLGDLLPGERAPRQAKKIPAFPLAVLMGKAGWEVFIHARDAIARCDEEEVCPRWTRFPGFRVSDTLAFP